MTANAALAKHSAVAKTDLQNTGNTLANFPPTITNGNVTLQVSVGQNYPALITLDVQDANNDTITYSLNSDVPSGMTFNSSTRVLSWTDVPDLATANLTLTVSDGTASSIWTPRIELCKCQNGATCDFSVSGEELFIIVPCICGTGYIGTFCETDKDGCAQNPCFQDVGCTDRPAAQETAGASPFTCAACPPYLVGDGTSCVDLDECATSSPCGHNCTNIAGSYYCSCVDGYQLGSDSKACVDVNECDEGKDNCDSETTKCNNTEGSFTCDCKTGYQSDPTNSTKCLNVNECSSGGSTCPSHSTCVDTEGSYQCVCDAGYKFDAQDITCKEIDECTLPNNCEQICQDSVNNYTCTCRSGFTLNSDNNTCTADTTCNATQILECDGGNNRSSCALDTANGGIICQCPKGFALNHSNYCNDIDECTTGKHVCEFVSGTCNNTEGSYHCSCKAGYQSNGDFKCEDINECTSGSPCNSPATCENLQGSFRCVCGSGYHLSSDGLSCVETDLCASEATNPCDKDNGLCVNNTCSCKTGYTGSKTCIDINECIQSDKGGCSQGCTNEIGSYKCYCFTGYELASDGKNCTDINECASSVDNDCHSNDYCTNTEGKYTCSCPANFVLKGDKKTCQSTIECASGHGCAYRCDKINGTDTCTCPNGYELNANNITCDDIDECSNSTLNNCDLSNNVKCDNRNGSFSCVCLNSSYEQAEEKRCTDIDECEKGTAKNPANSVCINLDPGYDWKCKVGYTKVGDVCQDINECTKGTHGCNTTLGECTNTEGGYTCACKTGYQGNGIDCIDIDECKVGTHGCDKRTERAICSNTVGSYTCNCTDGYVLASNGQTCNDVDECNLNTDGCEYGCTNRDGGYDCTCNTGYRLDVNQRSCIVEKECNAAFNATCGYQCARINGNDTCVCQTGYQLASNQKTCEDINECVSSSPCDSTRGVCNNTVGGFECSCQDNYTLGPGNVCKDRDGNWSPWSAWGSCSVACGHGQQSRTRTCSNPTAEGAGAPCQGQSSESQQCDAGVCQPTSAEAVYGVVVSLHGVTLFMFNTISSSFKETVVTKVNSYCNHNTSAVQHCCNVTKTYSPDPNNPLTFTQKDKLEYGAGYPKEVSPGVDVLLVIKYVQSNALCSAVASYSSSRRRRRSTGVVLQNLEFALPQAVLQDILNDVSVQNDLAQAIEAQIQASLGQSVNVTIANVNLVTTTTTTTTTTTQQSPIQIGRGTDNWVIAVATVGALVGVVVVVMIIILLVKINLQNKVYPVETQAAEQNESHG